MYIVTRVIKINVTIETQGMREPPARMSKNNGSSYDVYTAICELWFGIERQELKDKMTTLNLLQ